MTESELSLESLRAEVRGCREDLATLSSDVRDLIAAWNTARGLVKFVKLLGTLATGFAAIWALWRLGK